ncbi:MAG: ArdC family protein [Patescibacteria group bacterium]
MKLSTKAQASIERAIEKFRTGDISSVTRIARIQLAGDAPVNKWSLSNKILAYLQADELDCRGFKQWQEAGRQVKKGSRAVYILSPRLVKQEDEKEQEKKSVCVGFIAVPVFAASSTEGDMGLPEHVPMQLPPLMDVARKLGIAVEYAPVTPDKLGDCKIDGSRIRLGSHDASVFFHELSHAVHAQIIGELRGGQQVVQETVAEFTAVVLMDLYGRGDATGNAWQYISHYSEDPLLAITKALVMVEKVLDVILSTKANITVS